MLSVSDVQRFEELATLISDIYILKPSTFGQTDYTILDYIVSRNNTPFSIRLKGRVERIFFFASFKLPLFNEYEMVGLIYYSLKVVLTG